MSTQPPIQQATNGMTFTHAMLWAGKPLPALPPTLLHSADGLGRNGLHYAACSNDVLAAADLLDRGVNGSRRDQRGMTPLHFAVVHQSYEVLETLLESGVDVNAQTLEGLTSVFLAAREGDVRALQMLIDAGANPNISNVDEVTPLHIAAANNEVEAMQMLVQRGGAFLNAVDNCGDSPLHFAVREGNIAAVHALLDAPSVLIMSAVNEDGETPAQLALELNLTDITAAFEEKLQALQKKK